MALFLLHHQHRPAQCVDHNVQGAYGEAHVNGPKRAGTASSLSRVQ